MARIRLINSKPSKPKNFKPAKSYGKLPTGKVGDYTYVFQTRCERTGQYSSPMTLKFDTEQDALDYVYRMTPRNHQGLLDGISVICK